MPSSTDTTGILMFQPGQTMPGFTLPDTSGALIRLKSFRQRRPVLVALLHSAACPDCRAWLSQLQAARDELAYRCVQPLLIFPDELDALRAFQAEIDAPGLFLSDSRGEARARLLGDHDATRPPALLVAVSRYSTCLDAWVADEPSHWPLLDEPLATFAFAEQEDCACGLPAWPEDA